MDDDDMAAVMGFSSFGGTKRKFETTNSPKTKPDASGANSTRLGVRPKLTSANADPHSKQPDADPTIVSASKTQEMQPAGQPKQSVATASASFVAHGQTLDQHHKPRDSADSPGSTVSFGGPAITQAELAALRYGITNEAGDTAYFLPSFVENPWEKLQQR
ncbi:hypothetical protein EJ04DRAFT_310768 [Polyplosphaeria fusca]|uniref:Uncharacterized protein n=1 Tax=Polyplosphaeria fusca TaxID=682080 RepID=A0A9P4R4Z0_9PLEO|nr:hypothetical protein EJ04DRAFT_310768 [Polyplosphaeria fusca]